MEGINVIIPNPEEKKEKETTEEKQTLNTCGRYTISFFKHMGIVNNVSNDRNTCFIIIICIFFFIPIMFVIIYYMYLQAHI